MKHLAIDSVTVPTRLPLAPSGGEHVSREIIMSNRGYKQDISMGRNYNIAVVPSLGIVPLD